MPFIGQYCEEGFNLRLAHVLGVPHGAVASVLAFAFLDGLVVAAHLGMVPTMKDGCCESTRMANLMHFSHDGDKLIRDLSRPLRKYLERHRAAAS